MIIWKENLESGRGERLRVELVIYVDSVCWALILGLFEIVLPKGLEIKIYHKNRGYEAVTHDRIRSHLKKWT